MGSPIARICSAGISHLYLKTKLYLMSRQWEYVLFLYVMALVRPSRAMAEMVKNKSFPWFRAHRAVNEQDCWCLIETVWFSMENPYQHLFSGELYLFLSHSCRHPFLLFLTAGAWLSTLQAGFQDLVLQFYCNHWTWFEHGFSRKPYEWPIFPKLCAIYG